MMGREFNNEIPDCVINSFGGVKSESMMLPKQTLKQTLKLQNRQNLKYPVGARGTKAPGD